MNKPTKKNDHFIIVGIGASAGGLAALKKFVFSLPEMTGMAYIIVQHLDPTHDSLLSEILVKQSKMPVTDAKDNEKVAPDHIYVIPPDAYLAIESGKIKLTKPEETRGLRKSIDHLFRSLAKGYKDSCAGIILSGSGSDGTAGLREIKATGGLVLAQDPETATHGSMPQSAIEAEVVDKVCLVEDMSEILLKFAKHPLKQKNQAENDDKNVENSDKSLEEIGAILKAHENFNINQYKPGTIQRRISRRMSLTNIMKYDEYLKKLRVDEEERRQLTKDLLINVTDFFRDPDAYEVIEKKVIPDILDNLSKKDDVRVWVAGCASGEEAYSLAILLLEALQKTGEQNEIKIFATDIDQRAIATARKGVYSESMAREVPKKYLEKYFIKIENDHRYKIKREVRDLISFAVQNLATDPPFNHMHLITCRNLLIYLKRNVQEKVLSSFYFALNNHSYLMLGSSESLGKNAEVFKTTSKKWRIYQKIPGEKDRKFMLDHLHVTKELKGNSEENRETRSQRDTASRSERLRRTIFENATPPTLLVDDGGKVLYSHGDLDNYINFPKGEPRFDLVQVMKKSLSSRMRSALYKAKNSNDKTHFHVAVKDSTGEQRNVKVEVTPMKEMDFMDGPIYMIVFTPSENQSIGQKESLTDDDEQKATADLEQELTETREELQNTIEELETSTEELKASHEESLSTNEELQSSNEELEASSEELRSLNEELSTVNAQLKEKIEELKRANDDAENLFTSTDLPTIFLSPELQIQRYTPAAEQLLKMGPRDIGREITSLGRDLVDFNLEEECKEVLRSFRPQRKEVKDYRGNCFIRQLTPYRTEDRRIEGVVIVYQDVTEIKELSQRAEIREQQQSVVARLGMQALSGTDPEDLMHQAVRQVALTLKVDFCKVLKYQYEQQNLIMVAGIGWQEGLVGQATVPNNQNSQAGYTLLSQEAIIVDDLNQEMRFSGPDLLLEHQVTSGISCLINHSDPPYGVLSVHTKVKRKFSQEDANFLVSVANLLSTAFRNRESQERINDSEQKFRTMANSIPQLAWMTDGKGYIFWYNQRWYDYTGTHLEEMEGWGWKKVHHPDHVERVVNHFQSKLDAGEAWEDTFPLRNKFGEYRWFLSRAKPIKNSDGQIIHWFGTNTDITAKLEREKALQHSEERLRLAKDSARFGIFEWDIAKNEIKWEPLLKEIWGMDPDEPIRLESFFEGLLSEDIDKTRAAIDHSLDPKGDGHYEVTYRVVNKKSRQIYWVRANATVVFENNQPIRMIGFVNDITEREKARMELTLSEERLRIAKDAAEIGIYEYEIATGNIHVDEKIRAIFGVSGNYHFTNQQFESKMHPDDLIAFKGLITKIINNEGHNKRYRTEYRVFNQELNDYIWVEAFGMTIHENGKPLKTINSLIDITKRKEVELTLANAVGELRDADERKNTFLSILGHELRNPLASVSASVQYLSEKMPEDDNVLKITRNGISNMSRLLDDLLDLNRVSQNRVKLEEEQVNIKKVLENVVQSTESLLKKRNHTFDLRAIDQEFIGDQVRLEQVFTNLLVNAVKYTPPGGHIEILSEKKDDMLHVEVKDNGIGLTEHFLDKIFTPFYQVKQEGQAMQGLGIGLALVKKLVELHGGTINAKSEGKNKGAIFTVSLPIRQSIVSDKNMKNTEGAQLKEGMKILLIEDNEDLLETMPLQLEALGCKVVTAATGKEGIAKVKTFKPDAMLVDIGLPDVSGHEIAATLRNIGYDGLMVALSGYSHEAMRAKSMAVGFDHHLSKPAKTEELTEILSKADDKK